MGNVPSIYDIDPHYQNNEGSTSFTPVQIMSTIDVGHVQPGGNFLLIKPFFFCMIGEQIKLQSEWVQRLRRRNTAHSKPLMKKRKGAGFAAVSDADRKRSRPPDAFCLLLVLLTLVSLLNIQYKRWKKLLYVAEIWRVSRSLPSRALGHQSKCREFDWTTIRSVNGAEEVIGILQPMYEQCQPMRWCSTCLSYPKKKGCDFGIDSCRERGSMETDLKGTVADRTLKRAKCPPIAFRSSAI